MSLEVQSGAEAVRADGLGDVLERVLDKGVVIAGDISLAVVGVELLTIKLRLIVASTERAEEIGIDWWRHDPFLSSRSHGAPQPSLSVDETLENMRTEPGREPPVEAKTPAADEAPVPRKTIAPRAKAAKRPDVDE